MKKYSAIILSALMMSVGIAQASVNLELREDYKSNMYDKSSATNSDNASFNLKVLRLDLKGKLSDTVDYRFRFKTNANRAVSARDNTGVDTDYAYVTNKFNDNLSLTLGKFASENGGWENQYSGADLYMETIAYGSTSNGLGNFRYYTGGKLTYLFEGQEFALHSANLTQDASGPANNGAGAAFDQNKTMTGLVYKGSFLDNRLLPIISYHMQSGRTSTPGVSDDNAKSTFTAVGLRWAQDMWGVEADYMANVLGGLTTIAPSSQNDLLNTMEVGAWYTMNQWTAKLKYENSIAKTETSATNEDKVTTTGAQIAVEYKPVTSDMFRYHVAYWSKDTKAEPGAGGSTTTTDKVLLVGTKIYADFLK